MILNTEQKKVVYANEHFLFLLASAGSGKTRVIVERIKYLVSTGIHPSHILAITFTRKAAFEMKERIENPDVHIHTFHQFCYLKLTEDFKSDFQVVQEEKLPFKKEEILKISKYKNSLFKLEKPKCYDRYQTFLLKHNMKDFDDLLIDFYRHIKDGKHAYNYAYICVDEFQDTNHLQYELLKKIIQKDTQVLAVGDPDQSIYKFRGARSQIIDQFIEDYHAKSYTLSINYRFNQSIATHVNRLIKRNNRKYKKEVISLNQTKTDIIHFLFKTLFEEATSILTFIKSIKSKGIKETEIAILYRNHNRSFELRRVFLEHDLDFQTYDDTGYAFFQGVQMMTIHQAKGLEFDCVIIIGLEQGLLPSFQQNNQSELDEERRLMFVAMTRAKKHLYFTSTKLSTNNHRIRSSCFIRESGVKTIKNKHINDIISLGDFNGQEATHDGIDPNP